MKSAVPTAVVVLAVLGLLAGCATPGPALPALNWKPRTDADQKADTTACKKDVDSVDFHSPGGSHYSAAVAMASRTNEVDLTSASIDRMRDAVMYQCMTEKGWVPAP